MLADISSPASESLRLAIRPIIVSCNRACLPTYWRTPSHDDTFAASVRLVRILGLLNLPNELLKGLGDVLIIASTSFGPGTLQLLRKFLAILGGDLTLLGSEITLVADNDNGEPLNTLGSRPLVLICGMSTAGALDIGQIR